RHTSPPPSRWTPARARPRMRRAGPGEPSRLARPPAPGSTRAAGPRRDRRGGRRRRSTAAKSRGYVSIHGRMADRIQLFHTCLVNEIEPDAGFAVARVLERVGCSVAVPGDQTCCGQPAYNAGFHDEARQVARHTIGVLERTDDPIVIPS